MLDDYFLIILGLVNTLTYYDVRTQPERQSDDETDTNLSYDLVFAFQTFFIAFEDLDIIIKESKESEPDSGDNHQYEIGIAYTSEQQYRYQYTNYNESITLTTTPIYYLDVNSRITVQDKKSGIYGDYYVTICALKEGFAPEYLTIKIIYNN